MTKSLVTGSGQHLATLGLVTAKMEELHDHLQHQHFDHHCHVPDDFQHQRLDHHHPHLYDNLQHPHLGHCLHLYWVPIVAAGVSGQLLAVEGLVTAKVCMRSDPLPIGC